MKLSGLWNGSDHLKRQLKQLTCQKSIPVVRYLIRLGILSLILWLPHCEEKLPVLQSDVVPLEFNTYLIPNSSDSIEYNQQTLTPYLGSSNVLFVGDDENVQTYTLLKFDDLSSLPDTLDSLIGVTLNLQQFHKFYLLGNDTPAVEISISQLLNNGDDPWTEDSSTVLDFDLANYRLSFLTSLVCGNDDTFSVALDTQLVCNWHREDNSDYTLVLQPTYPDIACIQALYSRETSYYPWLRVNYIEGGETTAVKILPEEDLSVIQYKKSFESETALFVSSGKSAHAFLRFKLQDLVPDQNALIAKANLHLTVNSPMNQLYGQLYYLYITVLDSVAFGDPNYDPKQQSYDLYRSIADSSTDIEIDIKSIIQGITSGYTKNYGLVLWATTGDLNIATLSFYNASALNPAEDRPYIEILTMKEQ
jgi:hypothetical protein